MPLFGNALAGAAGQGGADAFFIQRSLRFNSANNSFLNRTPSAAGSQTTWTWSCWIKLSDNSDNQIFGEDGGYPNSNAFFQSDGKIRFTAADASSAVFLNLITAQVFRDYSAWYHIICVLDTTNSIDIGEFFSFENLIRFFKLLPVPDIKTAVFIFLDPFNSTI